ADQVLEADGQGHKPRHAWHPARFQFRRRNHHAVAELVPPLETPANVQVALDGHGLAHRRFSFLGCAVPFCAGGLPGGKVIATFLGAPSYSTRCTSRSTQPACSSAMSVSQAGSAWSLANS